MKNYHKLFLSSLMLLNVLCICSCANSNSNKNNGTRTSYVDFADDFAITYQKENTIEIKQSSLDFLNSSLNRSNLSVNNFYEKLNEEQQIYLNDLVVDYKSAMSKRDKKETDASLSQLESIKKITQLDFSRYGGAYVSFKYDYSCSLKSDYLIWSLFEDNLLKSCHTDSIIKPRPTMYYNFSNGNSIETKEEISSFINCVDFNETNSMKISLDKKDYFNYLDGHFSRTVTEGLYLKYFEVEYLDGTIETLILNGIEYSSTDSLICKVYKFTTPTTFYEAAIVINYDSLMDLFK